MANPVYDAMGNFTGVYADETPQQPAPTTANPQTSNTGTTQSGSTGTNTYGMGVGKRQYNPLSIYSSYTYQISLYMITPDALAVFNRNGRKEIFRTNNLGTGSQEGSGAYLIAQSGGIENDTYRAPGFHFDYYIDNLSIDSKVAPAASGGPTVNYQMSFNIIEQYGLSFLTNLKRAKKALDQYSSTENIKDSNNPGRQFFILGIKFLGYDADGVLITQSKLIDEPNPTFQRFYDIQFTDVKFKIDGKTTIYTIAAQPTPIMNAFGQKRGLINKGANQLTGNTVKEILDKLMTKITDDQEAETKTENPGREFANKYKVEFTDDAQDIAASTIVSSADTSKIKWPMAEPKDTGTVNDNLSIKAQPNNKERILAFNRETPILQAITSVIKQSDYLVNGLKEVYTTDTEPNSKTNSPESKKIDSNKRIKWFSVIPKLENTKFDTKLKDWTYDITYQIRTYEIPILKSAYADKATPYYGAVKRYEYWWTGENTEIIKYEQTMKNTYFTVAIGAGNATSASTGGEAQVPIVTGLRQKADRLGKLDIGMEAQNSIETDLTDPSSWAEVKIELLGDPDWLSSPVPVSGEKSFYGPDGYSIDFSSGQVFIEIKFLEAVDYDHGKGVMNINDKIIFWDYPVAIAEQLKGAISYQVINIKNYFKLGKFTQELTCKINTFPEVSGPKLSQQARENAEYTDYEMRRLQNRSSGLTKDPTVTQGTTAGNQTVGSNAPATTQDTTFNGVANDDASASTAYVDPMGNYYGGRGT